MEGNESSECTICGIKMRSTRSVTYKVSSCCANLGVMHNACAKKYHLKQYPNPTTPFCLETWAQSLSIKMLCIKCRVNCLFCNSKHALNNDNIAFIQCSKKECTSWSYYLPPALNNSGGCVSKSKQDIKTVICEKCLSGNKTNDMEQETVKKLREVSKKGTFEEISQISLQTNSAYHRDMYDAIYSFKHEGPNFINTFKDYKECDDFLSLHFSHLDPTQNNIFKPNDPVEKGLDGLYLTVNSLKRLICSFQNGWLNDIMFTQMADLMNFMRNLKDRQV